MDKHERIAHFLYEIGTMRRIPRAHIQALYSNDVTDTIASHSYRVTWIAWFIAKAEGLDPYKTVMMALLHDLGEVRAGDQHWVNKRYVKVFDDEVIEEQLGTLPFGDLKDFAIEYDKRESNEAHAAKDADMLDQMLILREYEMQGVKEATIWLHGKQSADGNIEGAGNRYQKILKTETARTLSKQIMETNPSDWWNELWTPKRR